MSQQDLLNRLEAAVARLEALGVSGGAAVKKNTGDEMDDASADGLRAVMDFEAFKAKSVPTFLAAFDAYPSLQRHKIAFEAAWENQYKLIRASALCKKPSDADLAAFLAPSVEAMNVSGNVDRDAKGVELNLQKALADAVQFLTWPFSPPTYAHVEAMRDAADMWLNRSLTEAKSQGEQPLAQARAFTVALKTTLTDYSKFLKEYQKMGVNWNAAGKDFNTWASGAAAAPAASAAPAAAAPKPVVAAPAPAAPIGNPLEGLKGGLNVTSGLKKVTDDMKTKNQKDLPPPTAPVPRAPVAKKEEVAAKPPSLAKQGDNWFCEWQWNQARVEVKDVTLQSSVYIGKARNSNIYISGKPKGVTIDGGFRVAVFVEEYLTSIELVNCDRVTVYVTGNGGNTYAIDKSKGCIINFSDAALAKDPTIVSSNISECNIQQQRGDDLIEVAIPEQYEHKIVQNTGKGSKLNVTANALTHG